MLAAWTSDYGAVNSMEGKERSRHVLYMSVELQHSEPRAPCAQNTIPAPAASPAPTSRPSSALLSAPAAPRPTAALPAAVGVDAPLTLSDVLRDTDAVLAPDEPEDVPETEGGCVAEDDGDTEYVGNVRLALPIDAASPQNWTASASAGLRSPGHVCATQL
jgi:hypothetical protein